MAKRIDISKPHAGDDRQQQAKQAMRSMKRILLHFRSHVDEQLRPQGVTTAQIQVLFEVRNAPASSGAHLARCCYITPQTMQALLRHLEKGGFIVRGKDPVNDRIVTSSITPAGEQLVHSVEKTVQHLKEDLWRGISDRDLAQLNTLLERAIGNLGIAEESDSR